MHILRAAVCLLLSGVLPVAYAAEGDCPPGAELLKQRLANLHTLSASFEQQIIAADGHPLQESSGVLELAKPGRIYWVAEPPFEQTVVSDGRHLWVYDPDLEQATVRALTSQLDNSPAALLVGDADRVLEEFHVCAFETARGSRILLRPLHTEAIYTQLEMRFEGRSPVGIRMIDSLGQETRIALTEVEINQPVDTAIFQFTPPPGVDVFRDD